MTISGSISYGFTALLTGAWLAAGALLGQDRPPAKERLTPVSGAETVPMTFRGQKPAEHAEDLRQYFHQKHPGVEAEATAFRMLVDALAVRVRKAHHGDACCLNTFDYNDVATSYNAWCDLAEALAKTAQPTEYQEMMKEHYAGLVRRDCVLEVETEKAALEAIPPGSRPVKVGEGARLRGRVAEVWPGFLELPGAGQKRVYDFLLTFNRNLRADGWYITPAKASERGEAVVIGLEGGARRFVGCYRLEGGLALLPPAEALIKAAAGDEAVLSALRGATTERPKTPLQPNAAEALREGEKRPFVVEWDEQ